MEEIKENANCITKAFENHPVFIFEEILNDKKTIILEQLMLVKF
jgi:hypothetical protein